MNFSEEYNQMEGMEEDDIPILDVGHYYAIEDFEEDMKLNDNRPEWVIIDNIIYKRKTASEILKDKLKKKDVKSSVRRKL